jgi:hypothetical protein
MKRTYQLGLDANEIELAFTAGTAGIAYTAVYLARSGGQRTKIAESSHDSGDIIQTKIGDAASLRGAYLVFVTNISCTNLDSSIQQNEHDRLSFRYCIYGGYSGSQIYNQDIDDVMVFPNGQIIVTKPIELL